MLYKEGDWVWFVWNSQIYTLPVGRGYPRIHTERKYFHDKPSSNIWKAHSVLSLATSDNHIIIDTDKKEWIYLCSFTKDQYFKIKDKLKDITIYQTNSKYSHYGYETKKRLDTHTIQFIKKSLEDQPMKADKKPKSVTATFKISKDDKGIVDLKEVGKREVTYEKTKWKVSWITPLTWDEEKRIFYSKGEPFIEHKEFETITEDLLSGIWDAKSEHQDMYIYSVFKNNKQVANLLGSEHIERKTLCTVNNFWWRIPNARMVSIKTERTDGVKLTLSSWAFGNYDIEDTIKETCKPPYKYLSHKVYTVKEWGAHINMTPEIEKKSLPSKKKKNVTNTPKKEYTYGSKAQRLAGKGKTREEIMKLSGTPRPKSQPKKSRIKSEPKRRDIVPGEHKLTKHQKLLEKKYLDSLKSDNGERKYRLQERIEQRDFGAMPMTLSEAGKQLSNEHYNFPKINTIVLNACETKYLHHLRLAKTLETKCQNALAELDRYRDLIKKHSESKSKKRQCKAVNIETRYLPILKKTYRDYVERYNEEMRLYLKWSAKVEDLITREYKPKVKRSTKAKSPIYYKQIKAKRPKHLKLVCVEDTKTGKISRMRKDEADKLDFNKYKIVSKETWKAQKRKEIKGIPKSGIIQITDRKPKREKITQSGRLLSQRLGTDFAKPKFERSFTRMERNAEQTKKQNQNNFGAMPRLRFQKVTIKVPKKSKSGQSIQPYFVYAQDAVQFTFKSNIRKIVKGEDGKLFFKNLNPIVYTSRVGKRVLLEKRVFNYNYTKPASTITKTIIHKSTYKDCTSMTTSQRSLMRHRK